MSRFHKKVEYERETRNHKSLKKKQFLVLSLDNLDFIEYFSIYYPYLCNVNEKSKTGPYNSNT
jgi:hypothetical protein